VKIEGRERLNAKIAAMPVKTREQIRKTLAGSAKDMVEAARRFAPVDSGALRNSIGFSFGGHTPDNANVRGVGSSGEGHALSVAIHAGDATAWYARLVEFGTSAHINQGKFEGSQHPGASARPYFYPAFRLTKKQLRARIRSAVSRAAKEAASL
jgi:HK97 gp10 family phage protein